MTDTPETEAEFPKKNSNGNGTTTGWYVEARQSNKYAQPIVIGEQIFDRTWRTVHFAELPPGIAGGVPNHARYELELDRVGAYGYAAAQALRWGLLAHIEASSGLFGKHDLDTRLVECKVEYTYKSQLVSAAAYVGGEDRSNMMPVWGKHENPGTRKTATPATTDTPAETTSSFDSRSSAQNAEIEAEMLRQAKTLRKQRDTNSESQHPAKAEELYDAD